MGVADWQHLIHMSDVSNKGAWESNFRLCLGGYNVGNSSKPRKDVQKKFYYSIKEKNNAPGKKLCTK